jgi:cytochrome P450
MIDSVFSEEMRRNPFPFYDKFRAVSPVLYLEPFDFWMIFDYDGVKRTLEDHATFSSAAVAPGSTGKPLDWLIFKDPPRHGRLRALVACAFTPRVVASLESRIRQISQELLDEHVGRGEMDLAADYSIPLPLMVIAEMLGIPPRNQLQFKRWSDAILNLAETVTGSEEAAPAAQEFGRTTAEMDVYLKEALSDRQRSPQEDVLSKLAQAEVDGERLTHSEILGFFQLLLLAGSETTINLINNAVLCLLEHPEQLARLRENSELLPVAIEEVLRFRSPLQAVFRQTRCAVQLHGRTIPAGQLVLPVIGSANRDPSHFEEADCFHSARAPNPHLAFGHGIHFCLGASLSRLEARIALADILARLPRMELASDEPWEPRQAFHVHGPTHLPIRFKPAKLEAALARDRTTEPQH